MLYFNPKPNFQQLSKYYTFPHTIELMEQYYPDGYPIVLDHVYTDEHVAMIDDGFKSIVAKYGIADHYDNLLFLTVGKIQEHEAVLDELYFQYDQRKRTKELAALLLAFTSSHINQFDALLLKTFKSTAKVSDKNTINWIGRTLTDAIRDGKMPLADYEYRLMKDFFEESENGRVLSPSKLAIEAERRVDFPTKGAKASYADICFYLFPYLTNETTIKLSSEKLFSDAMKNFYFDVLVLFDYLKPDNIESDGKDYIQTLLKNRIKKLNPDYQGNKR